MARVRLSTLLVGINCGLLLLGLLLATSLVLGWQRRERADHALRQATRAVQMAQASITTTSEQTEALARLLAATLVLQNPTDPRASGAQTQTLATFQAAHGALGCAIVSQGAVLAQAGLPLPWAELAATRSAPSAQLLIDGGSSHGLLLGGWAALPALPNDLAIVAVPLDAAFAQRLSATLGVSVTLGTRSALPLGSSDPRMLLRIQAVLLGENISGYVRSAQLYAAVAPLLAANGQAIGFIETALPLAAPDLATQTQLGRWLLLGGLLLLVVGWFNRRVGRSVERPLRQLTLAAARMNRDDLSRPLPTVSGSALGALPQTLEQARRRLFATLSELRRQEAEAQAILTGIVEGVFTVDRERRLRYLNPQLAQLLGITPEAALGRFCGDVLRPQGPGGLRPCAEQCPIIHARFRQGARATEHLLLADGQQRTVVITSAPAAGDWQVQVVRDETEIEGARRLRDAIMANISHEFRTPLSAQLASLELLLDQLPDLSTEQVGQLVLALQRGTLRLTRLIDNLLESARIEAGQHTIRRQSVSLDEVIEEALQLTRPLLDQRSQQVEVQLPYPLPSVVGDGPRLTQVFVNLLANANKYAPPGSTIEIGGRVTSTMLELWVADQGPGLPPLTHQALFARFVRAATHEPEQSGVGLGLWIVQWIIERHGGQINVETSATGTRMIMSLPQEVLHENIGRG